MKEEFADVYEQILQKEEEERKNQSIYKGVSKI